MSKAKPFALTDRKSDHAIMRPAIKSVHLEPALVERDHALAAVDHRRLVVAHGALFVAERLMHVGARIERVRAERLEQRTVWATISAKAIRWCVSPL